MTEGIIRTMVSGVVAVKILDMGTKMITKKQKKMKLKYPEIKKKQLY